MPKQTFVVKRNGTYYFRKRLPDDVASYLGKREIKKSLSTSDYKKACTLANIEALKADQEIERARAMAKINNESPEVFIKLEDFDTFEIERMVLVWFAKKDQAAKEEVAQLHYSGLPPDGQKEIEETLIDEVIFWYKPTNERFNAALQIANRILNEAKVRFNKTSTQFSHFLNLVQEAMLESADRAKARIVDKERADKSFNAFFRQSCQTYRK